MRKKITKMDYYTKIGEEHKESCMCNIMINWNPKAISKNEAAYGFIVQHFTRSLITEYSIDIPQNTNYYEAWRVLEGKVKDRGNICDDIFSIGNDFQLFDLFKKCAGTSGRYEFTGDVFWIPDNHRLFNLVSSWDEWTVKEAAGLKSTYVCDDFNLIEPVFSRIPFIHEWDLTDDTFVYNTAKKILFRYCHSRNDKELLLNTIDNVIPIQYEHMKEAIIDEWDKRWK